MATMRELQAEYELLTTNHRNLIDERCRLERDGCDGAAFQDHDHRMRSYMAALDSYVLALQTRRREMQLRKSNHSS